MNKDNCVFSNLDIAKTLFTENGDIADYQYELTGQNIFDCHKTNVAIEPTTQNPNLKPNWEATYGLENYTIITPNYNKSFNYSNPKPKFSDPLPEEIN